jgi:archaellin
MRSYKFTFEVICASQGDPDLPRVESMIDLVMQDLVFDDAFIEALDEGQAVTIQVTPQFGKTDG